MFTLRNIINILLRLIVFYIINLIILLLIGEIFGSDISWLITSKRTWLFPLFVVLGGLFFGYLTVRVQKLTRKSVGYNYCLAIVSVIVALLLFGTRYTNWKYERNHGNIEANKDFFKYFSGQYEYQVKLAFDTLSTKFVHPNDFRILGNFTEIKDSSINGESRTVYLMTYFYQRKIDRNYYKANFTVFNDTVNLLNLDEPLNLDDYSTIVRFGEEGKTTFTKAWRQLPDSVKELIKKELPEFSD